MISWLLQPVLTKIQGGLVIEFTPLKRSYSDFGQWMIYSVSVSGSIFTVIMIKSHISLPPHFFIHRQCQGCIATGLLNLHPDIDVFFTTSRLAHLFQRA